MLPGAHRVAFRRAGSYWIYWYSERGPKRACLWRTKAPTQAEAEAAEQAAASEIAGRYSAAVEYRPARGFVSSLILDFKTSAEWKDMAASTQKEWSRHLDAIDSTFGQTSLAGMQRRGARKLIKKWHRGMEATPRKANYALTVLVRLFNWAIDQEDMERNPAANIARIDEGEGRAGVIWTDAELARLLKECRPAMQRAVRLCFLTGLRREDLVRLRWNEIDRAAGLIRRPTGKGKKHRRVARIPITAAIADLLDAMPKTATQVVTKEDGTAYATPGSFSKALERPMKRAKVLGPDGGLKHLHDMRGTRATLVFAGGMSDAEAENLFAWAPGSGGKMRGIYGDPETIARATVDRLQASGE